MNGSGAAPFPFVVLEFESQIDLRLGGGGMQMALTVPEWQRKPLRGKASAIIVIMAACVARWADWNVASVAKTCQCFTSPENLRASQINQVLHLCHLVSSCLYCIRIWIQAITVFF